MVPTHHLFVFLLTVYLGARNIRDRRRLAALFAPEVRAARKPLHRVVPEGFFVGTSRRS